MSRSSRRMPPRARLVGLALASAIVLAACGSGASDEKQTSSAEGKAGLESAREAIATRLERPVSIPDLDPPIPVTEKLAAKPVGKKFVFVQCSVPECAFLAAQAKKAATILGADLNVIKAGGDAQSISDAFQSALDSQPDAILQAAIDPATWTTQLKAIKAAGIPVVSWTIPDDPSPDGITVSFNGSESFNNSGRLMADYVIADTDGKAKSVIFYPPEYTVFKGLAEAYAAEIKKNCPGCEVAVEDAPASEIGSKLPGRVVSYLQANPDTDYVVGAFGSVLIGVPQAIKAAGVGDKIRTISQAGGQVNFQYIKEGNQTVDLSADLSQEAWMAIDMAARLSTGKKVDPDSAGSRTAQKFLTQEQIDFDPAKGYESYPEYQDYFKQLWGVQ